MRASQSLPRIALFAIAVAAIVVAGSGAAQAQIRDFSGRIVQVSGSQLIVDSAGDKIAFVPVANVKVTGRRSSVGELKKNDRVTISWKLADSPRKAYKIVVHPARKND